MYHSFMKTFMPLFVTNRFSFILIKQNIAASSFYTYNTYKKYACKPQFKLLPPYFLSMKWQWTYGPTLLPWLPGFIPYMGGTCGFFKII